MKKITRLLIANRGEIAVRIVRACRDRGIVSIAIYSDQDRNALHVALANEAYCLEGKSATETYLNVNKVLELAKLSRADAVHPGYGFLAESPSFAEAVVNAGLIWVGPSAETIALLADKLSARKIAQQVGVPVVPGGNTAVSCAAEVHDFADRHGLPVAIKAAYGGGGLGMKVIRRKGDVNELFESAQREAQAAFGNKECFIEKYIDRPRHIETQCLADLHGNVRVISTRDCSVQRRHQKLIEEAPAWGLTEAQRETLVSASRAVMKAANYSGAGTCEFLLSESGELFFLEVNARLQVEHPVTEEITGIDLVAEQIEIAEGKIFETFDMPECRGHSIEFRINAEDPASNFMPRSGKINKFIAPAGPGIRVDSGIRAGDTVGTAFDSMLCKLIVTGQSREAALARARRALAEFTIDGVTTLIPFHQDVLRRPDFVNGLIYTGWVENEYRELRHKAEDAGPVGASDTGSALSYSDGVVDDGAQVVSNAQNALSEKNEPRGFREVVVEVNKKRVVVRLPEFIGIPEVVAKADVPRSRARRERKTIERQSDSVLSPMQAVVVKVSVVPDQAVKRGDLLVVLEAMKMEQPITSPRDGVVEAVSVQPGETVPGGVELLRLKKE